MLHRFGKLFCCCRKASFVENRCSNKFAHADKRALQFSKGRNKLTRDLDIVRLIQRQQMHDVNKQVLYTPTEAFLLQY